MRRWNGILFYSLFFLISPQLFSQPATEFRGVWVATVDNIDWPPKGNFNTDSQKAEFIKLLDMHQRNGMNAIIAQVRPATDAFYPSDYEPWSEWLTGKQGQAPNPYYDPLQFMIEETHKRGMEFHAWCNPYRAEFAIGKSSIAENHITRVHPEWFLAYGTTRYFDPGNKDAQQFVVKVVRDIVKRYNVDAIHFDDYFYPYRIAGKEFPDNESYQKYGNGLSKDDWRRSNVDSVILFLSKAIKEERKYCRFGISPFGVWRNASVDSTGSATRAGQTNYDDLYADIILWLKNGWIDYVAPQLYWEFTQPNAPFGVLVDWWSKHTYGRPCYIGLGIYRAGSNAAWKDATLIPRMISTVRNTPNMNGVIYFSSKSFNRNSYGWNDSLRNNYYQYPAKIAPMPWIDSIKPEPPIVHLRADTMPGGTITLTISNRDAVKKIKSFVVYRFNPADSTTSLTSPVNILRMIPANAESIQYSFPAGMTSRGVLVSAIDFQNNESIPVVIEL